MSHIVVIGSENLPVIVRKHPSSRRIVIRYQPRAHCVSLTLPRYVGIAQGLAFVEEKRGWLVRQLQEQPRRVPFADGEVIPVLGKPYRLKHVGGRGVVRIIISSPRRGEVGRGAFSEHISVSQAGPHPNPPPMGEGIIEVPGAAEFMARRVREFLKVQAKAAIAPLAHERARALGKPIGRLSFRDTGSHWGSCTRGGRLSFSWRLVLAPYAVLDYVVAHETAHLKHLNHSPAFWQTVAELCPHHEEARAWLKERGGGLYAYGI